MRAEVEDLEAGDWEIMREIANFADMKKLILLLQGFVAIAALAAGTNEAAAAEIPEVSAAEPVDYANPMIGTDGMDHTFPGACVPFGIVQLSPDTDTIPHNVDGVYQLEAYLYCAGYRHCDPTIVG